MTKCKSQFKRLKNLLLLRVRVRWRMRRRSSAALATAGPTGATPGSPTKYVECVPPITKLWNALAIGGSFPTADAVYISTQLKSLYGNGFAITMAPNGNNVGSYLPAAVALHQAGALDDYGQQYYDFNGANNYSNISNRVGEAIRRGLPASKIGIGFALTSPVSGGAWTVSGAQSAMQQAKAQFGIRKAYLWAEDGSFTNGQVQAWLNAMAAVQ